MYFFFDLDGTLLGISRKLHEDTKRAIEQLHEDGHKIFLCSGRTPEYLMKGIAKQIPVDGIVGCAGGVVYAEGSYIFENVLDKELIGRTVELLDSSPAIMYRLETRDCAYATDSYLAMNERFFAAYKAQNADGAKAVKDEAVEETVYPIDEFDPKNVNIQKMLFYTTGEHAFDEIGSEIDRYYHTIYYYESPQISIGELIPKSCTKADGINAVLEYYKADALETVCFGDGMNDYQMMEIAGIAAVWEGGPEELKALADYYFIDPDEGGIALALQEMGFV